jgi:lipopolysaccharide transport protein LptA
MATLFPERCARGRRMGLGVAAGAVAITVLTGASHTGTAVTTNRCQINVDSGPTDVDYQTHLINLRGGVKISQTALHPEDSAACDVSVAAESAQATGIDFNNSKWVFNGKVHIQAESQGELHSDRASVEFTNNVLARAIVTGSPAQFQQTRSTAGRLVKGEAATIDYEVAAGTVKLIGDKVIGNAWLTDDHSDGDIHSPTITYNIRGKRLEGDAGTAPGARVHMTITPKGDLGASVGSAPTATGSGPERKP